MRYHESVNGKRHASPFPIKCDICSHSVNVTTGLSSKWDVYEERNSHPNDRKPVALDCEMVGVGPKLLNALGRISIVDYMGNVLYDVMVRPEEAITDFRTRWSGIRPSDMRRAIPFVCAQEQVRRIIQNRIVIGHMVRNDFAVLRLRHPEHLIRDTARAPYPKLIAGFPTDRAIGLRALTIRLFGVSIQNGEHCSVEDARATMAIYRLVQEAWEADLLKSTRERPTADESNMLNATVCLPAASPLTNGKIGSLKRLAPDTTTSQSARDVSHIECDLDLKRRCKSLPSTVSVGLTKSSSSASLLDDDFWPDRSDELVE